MAITEHIHCIKFYLFHECPLGWRLQVLDPESGKEHSHIFMKDSLGKWHPGGQSIMWLDGVKVSLTLENLGQ